MTAKSSQPGPVASNEPGPTRGRRPTAIFVSAALVPFVASWFFGLTSVTGPPLTTTKSRPSLVFATYLYHHGEDPVSLDSTLESEFRFRNDGTETVTIGEIERSCGCLSPRPLQKQLAPGEIGSLIVPIQTISQSPGPHEYTLTVHYTDTQPQQVTLTIKATFPKKMIVVQPKSLAVSQHTDRPIPFDVSISDFRDRSLTVTGVESTAWFVSADVSHESTAEIVQAAWTPEEDSDWTRTNISGQVAGSIPPGRHHALVAVTTDDPDFPVVTVPMLISGPLHPEGKAPIASPSQVRLVASGHPTAKRTAVVQVVMPSSWHVSHAAAWPTGLSVEFDEGTAVSDSEKSVALKIDLAELPPAKVTDGVVQLFANDGKDLVTVKVSFYWP